MKFTYIFLLCFLFVLKIANAEENANEKINWTTYAVFQLPALFVADTAANDPQLIGTIETSVGLLLAGKTQTPFSEPIVFGFISLGAINISVEHKEERKNETFLLNYAAINIIAILQWSRNEKHTEKAVSFYPNFRSDGIQLNVAYRF